MIVVNPIVGGGLSNSKLALATATAADVVEGKTFYAGSKTIKAGTMQQLKMVQGSSFWSHINYGDITLTIETGLNTINCIAVSCVRRSSGFYREVFQLVYSNNISLCLYGYSSDMEILTTSSVLSITNGTVKISNISLTLGTIDDSLVYYTVYGY